MRRTGHQPCARREADRCRGSRASGRTRGVSSTSWCSAARSTRSSGSRRYFPFSKFSDAELMQYRCPVGLGPSSNTCPRCAPQREQTTSTPKNLFPPFWLTFSFVTGAVKLGQRVPESNLVPEVKRSFPQQMHL